MTHWLRRCMMRNHQCRCCALLVLPCVIVVIICLYLPTHHKQNQLLQTQEYLQEERHDGGGGGHSSYLAEEVEVNDDKVRDSVEAPRVISDSLDVSTHLDKKYVDLNESGFAVVVGIMAGSSLTGKQLVQSPHGEELIGVFTRAFSDLLAVRDDTSYNINTGASVSISAARHVPDTRPAACHNVTERPNDLASVSIIIPYYLEHWSALLRNLYSIYDRTEQYMIHEIILVDDHNADDELQRKLRHYLAQLPKVRLLRTNKREGLIRARMIGTRAARAEILVILDAHIEVNTDWLAPLILEITKNRKTIAIPALDTIDATTLEYKPWISADYGSFDWELDYTWIKMPESVEAKYRAGQSVPTATLLGCAMAVDREYWFSLGGLDEGLNVWGGESLEMSFRTWMCGGQLRIVPCSKIGHVFRSNLPYIFNMDIVYTNLQRVAEVWMDKYKKYYFQTTNKSFKFSDAERQSLQKRQQLRHDLRCKDFSWYLDNIADTVHPPALPCVLFGSIKNLAHKTCISVNQSNRLLTLNTCGANPHAQTFYLTPDHHIQYNSTTCLTFSNPNKLTQALLGNYVTSDPAQKWLFSPIVPNELQGLLGGVEARKSVGRFMIHYMQYRHCLQAIFYKGSAVLVLQRCDHYKASQYWIISHEIHNSVKIMDNLDDS